MLATRLLRLSASRRLLHTTTVRAAAAPGKDTQLSQGNDGISSDTNESPGDVQSQSAKGGQEAHAGSASPMDAASSHTRGNQSNVAPGDRGSNREGVGLQDQVGGQGSPGHGGEMGGREEAQAPGVLSSVKQALGMGTTAGDVKQNQHGGRGVTGTGTTRKLHTSARQRRGLHTSARVATGHSADSYFKDVDDQAPSDSKAPHAVDSNSSALDAPGETATGPFSQEGKGDAAYQNVSESSPYDKPNPGPGAESDEKLRYGNVDKWNRDKGGETANEGDGPSGASAGGRKPE